MADEKQTHINVLPMTRKQLAILASVNGTFVYEQVEALADEAWKKAKAAGQVTDAMIQSPTQPIKKKRGPR